MKAALHKCPGKSGLHVNHVLSVCPVLYVLSCPVLSVAFLSRPEVVAKCYQTRWARIAIGHFEWHYGEKLTQSHICRYKAAKRAA